MKRLVYPVLLTVALATASCAELPFELPDFSGLWNAGAGESIDPLGEKAARGDAAAQYRLGAAYNMGRGVEEDHVRAVAWFRRAAEQGYDRAQYRLGAAYNTGRGVAEDHARAVAWFRKAAAQGYAKAEYRLGAAYNVGRGVAEDHARAVAWYARAAAKGYARAQYRLGRAYATGRGVERDGAWGALWYRRAAEQGDDRAQYRLGVANAEGRGVPVDLVEAYKWLSLAAGRGHRQSEDARDEIGRRMTAAEIGLGERRARAWSPRATAPNPDAAAVRFVQHALGRLGYAAGAVDGVVGRRARSAITAYQRKAGLSADGAVTPALVEHLRANRPPDG